MQYIFLSLLNHFIALAWAGNPAGKQYIKASIEKDIEEQRWTNSAKPHQGS